MLSVYLSILDTQEEKDLFEELYIEYRQEMYGLAYKILNNKEDAEDAVQNSFLSVANSFTKISQMPRNEIGAYFVIVCRNTSINIYRKNKLKAERAAMLDDRIEAEDLLNWQIRHDELVDAIGKLPQEYKDVLFLYDLEDLPAKNVAKVLGISENNVRIRAYRARKMLKEELERGDNND